MSGPFSHLPEDIAAEKRTAAEFRTTYRSKLFGGLRRFRALRLQAPGIIAEHAIVGLILLATLAVYAHKLRNAEEHTSGWEGLVFFIVFWLTSFVGGRLVWFAVGVSGRNGLRYLVRNIWLMVGIIFVGSFVLSVIVLIVSPK